MFVRARPASRSVHSRSLGSFGRTKGVVGFIRFRLVHSSAQRGSSDSFRFIRTRPGGSCRVHSGSFGRAQGVVEFILGHHWGRASLSALFLSFLCAPGVFGFIPVRLDHSGAPRGSIAIIWFIRACPRVVVYIWVRRAPGVVRFIGVHSGVLRRWSGAFVFVWFI